MMHDRSVLAQAARGAARVGARNDLAGRTQMNLLIVDNEPKLRAELVGLCERIEDLRVVGKVSSGAKAIQAAEALRPDLLFLDCDLPDMSGFDVLGALRARHQRRTIVMTASSGDATTVLAAGALDCLVKPVSPEAFAASIARARTRFRLGIAAARRFRQLSPRPAAVDNGGPVMLIGERERRLYPLDPKKIDYIESAGNYVKYHIANTEYIARESVKHLDEFLCPTGFVRIERSLLLNVRAIAYAEPVGHGTFVFTLVSGKSLHSGPAYREAILDVLPLRRRAPTRGGKRAHPLAD